jgi:hypothetical protein
MTSQKNGVKKGKMSSIKVMVAFGQQTFNLIDAEAKERGVTVQELLRAVIIPDWFRTHGELLTKITLRDANRRIQPLTKPETGLDQGSKFHSNRLYLV